MGFRVNAFDLEVIDVDGNNEHIIFAHGSEFGTTNGVFRTFNITRGEMGPLQNFGTDADTDGYVDGASLAVNTTGFKGFLGCNGVLGMSGFTTGASGLVGDEVELVVSGDPGSDTVIVLKFFGFSSSSDAS